jgi:hypothetical protein
MQNTLFGCSRCILPSQSIQQVAAQLWVTSLPQGSFEYTQCSVTFKHHIVYNKTSF